MIKQVIWITFVLGLVSAPQASAQSFFTNYLKPEYLVPVGDFPSTSGGDRNLVYYQVQTPILKGSAMDAAPNTKEPTVVRPAKSLFALFILSSQVDVFDRS